jgi:rhamnogalacturonyl hydrolase YesR
MLDRVAGKVVKDSPFRFVDRKTGQSFTSPELAPAAADLIQDGPYTDWRYWNGVLDLSMDRLGEVLHDSAYARYSARNAAFTFDHYQFFKNHYKDQGKWAYPFGQFFIMEELDDCGAMGAALIDVCRSDPQKRYLDYIDRAADHVSHRQARLGDGTLVRTFPQQWTLWADDLYMGVPLLARLAHFTGNVKYFDDAALQVVNFQNYLFDSKAGLMAHCWFSDTRQTGVAFWGRASGWAMVAQIELLDLLPKNHPSRDTLLTLLQRQIRGVARYQSPSGLWHQLLDKNDSYLETSCSAMFTYAIARAVNKGYIESRYARVARRGWEGVMSKIRDDGQIEGICTGTGVGDDLVFYYHRPAPLNDTHGIGVVLLAGSELLRLKD